MVRKKIDRAFEAEGHSAMSVISVCQYLEPVNGKYWFRVNFRHSSYLCETVVDVQNTLKLTTQLLEPPC